MCVEGCYISVGSFRCFFLFQKLKMHFVLDMDIPTMIKESTTLAQLLELEKKFSFNEHEKTLIFEQRISILGRLMQWGVENEAMGLVRSISDSWTPEQRQQFIEDWMDDEPLIQEGFGKKRSYDEMRDDDSETSAEVRDGKTYFVETDLKQVRDDVSRTEFSTGYAVYAFDLTADTANANKVDINNSQMANVQYA